MSLSARFGAALAPALACVAWVCLSAATASAQVGGPLLHWTLDETAGSFVREEASGRADVAQVVEPVELDTPPLAVDCGTAAAFTNDAGRIEAGSYSESTGYQSGPVATPLLVGPEWTIAAWATMRDSGGDYVVLSSATDGPGWFLLGFRSGRIFFDFTSTRVYSAQTVPANTPMLIVQRADSSGSLLEGGRRQDLRAWYGGSWHQLTEPSQLNRWEPLRLQSLEIGSFLDVRPQVGAIDDVRIYDRALSDSELDSVLFAGSDDLDGDGIPNDEDGCPCTPPGEPVVAGGCSIADLCSCGGGWRNHGQYVKCVSRVTRGLVRDDVITDDEREAIVEAAAESACGKLSADRALAVPGGDAELTLSSNEAAIAQALRLEAHHDPELLGEPEGRAGDDLGSGWVAASRVTGAASSETFLESATPAALPLGHLLTLSYGVSPDAEPGLTELELSATAPTVGGEDQPLASLGATVEIVECIGGDLWPEAHGDQEVGLADYLHALALAERLDERAVADARLLDCGDLSPGKRVPGPEGSASYWCPRGDSRFDRDDLALLRRLAAGELVQSCAGGFQRPPASSPKPGDVAPEDEPDGRVDVGDLVLVLRWAVGLDAPAVGSPEHRLADVAPARQHGALRVAEGDGRLEVDDVVVLLRAAVGLAEVAWPEHELAVTASAEFAVSAWSATLTGLPDWAGRPTIDETADCGLAAGGGLDASEAVWALTCLPSAELSATEESTALLRYRAPWPLELGKLRSRSQAVDRDLAPVDAAIAWSPR